MLKPRIVETCKSCGYNNAENAKRCNGCGQSFNLRPFIDYSPKSYLRWVCPTCNTINMKENNNCAGCNYKIPSNCFITSATLLALSKKDDCYELNKFREFRDTYLTKVSPQLIDEYYKIAPSMVATLDSRADKNHIYNALWNEYLLPCLKLIEEGKYEETQKHYVSMVRYLEELLK